MSAVDDRPWTSRELMRVLQFSNHGILWLFAERTGLAREKVGTGRPQFWPSARRIW